MNNPEQSREAIGKNENFRIQTSRKIEEYLREGLPVAEMAQILNAKDFVGVERRKGKEFTHFRVKEYVDSLIARGSELQLPEQIIQSNEVILPPDQGEIQQAVTGKNKLEKPKYIPRTQFLMEVLSDMQIPYSVISGRNDPNMVRKLSYQTFVLQGESKIIMVNNEEGNATYVIRNVENPTENWGHYSKMTKQQLQELESRVVQINYSNDPTKWKERLRTKLSKEAEQIKKPRNTKKIALHGLDDLPEGWKSASDLAHDLGVDFSVIKKELDGLGIEDKTQCFRNKIGRAHNYISPEAIRAITSKINGRADVPDGWKTLGQLADEMGLDISTIHRKLGKYEKNNPEGVKIFKSRKTNHMIQCISPELVQVLTDEVKNRGQYEKIPDNWMSLKALSRKLGKDRTSVVGMVNKFRKNHPEWFHSFLVNNNIAECVSLNLIQEIEEEISLTSEIPDGWKNSHEIFMDLKKVNPSIIYFDVYNFVHDYVESHGNQFVRSLRKNGKLLKFYSPSVIDAVSKAITKLKSED